ncbi:3-oxoacyl-[acyl-carrier-protein] reductase [bacterium]|nr:3-oxoacyl-[acyl-carrier-protein] reductase [bacterium]NIN92162.1 3-oxoacyl-[acyl-carrier-protein] reductase [bacterium]NIO18820.1 3-oxoacyl-[acyl-carrier-protein] reductase [bacterium]NIO73904.1 3-oxoacyl-[acyl-carrier-protein] reductase [bacterium]
MDLKGKVAIVTGGAQGIGKSIASQLAQVGANVVIADVMEEVAKSTAQEISQKANESISIKVDVSSLSSVEEMVKKTLDKFGRIDILVNNAGITRDALVMRMKEEDWDLVLDINLKGAFNCIKAVSPIMVKQKSGKIVNIASIVGIIGNVGQANYSASKAGLIALTKTCARELASRRINVNAVAPGFIQTSMTERLPAQVKEKLSSQIPFGEIGKPEDVASAVLFLVSEKASYITGEVVRVDGGMAM